MTKSSRKTLSVIVGIAISVVLMWLLFRNIEFDKLTAALQGANYFWLIPNVLMIMLTMYLRAYRWSFMVRPVKDVAFHKLLAATCIGFMANNVLPLRLGEFVRAYSLSSQDRDVSKSASMATIFVERMVFDLTALLIIFGAVMGIAAIDLPDEMRFGIYFALTIALTGLVSVMLLARHPERSGDYLTRYLFFLPARIKNLLKEIVVRFSAGLEFITQFRTAASVGGQTLLIWLLMGISNYFVFLAFGFEVPLVTSYLLLVVVSVSILVPSSPGFLGVYHWAVVFALTELSHHEGIGTTEAVSFALVLHAAQYIPITLMGFYFLKKEHLSLKQLEDESAD